VALSIQAKAREATTITVDYQAPHVPAGAVIAVAVVERSAVTEVRRGENAGRTLRHANVVRAFVAAPAQTSGSAFIHVPATLLRDNGEVIACVQRPSTDSAGLPVLGCARAILPP
jgi:hypothetical protein